MTSEHKLYLNYCPKLWMFWNRTQMNKTNNYDDDFNKLTLDKKY